MPPIFEVTQCFSCAIGLLALCLSNSYNSHNSINGLPQFQHANVLFNMSFVKKMTVFWVEDDVVYIRVAYGGLEEVITCFISLNAGHILVFFAST